MPFGQFVKENIDFKFIKKEFAQVLIKKGLAQKFPYGENWIQFKIFNQESVHHAILLFKLHYDKLRGIDSGQLFHSIPNHYPAGFSSDKLS